jgi:hypothetical protein
MRNGPRGHAGESGEPASFKGAGLEVFNKAQMMAGATVNFAFTDYATVGLQHHHWRPAVGPALQRPGEA